MEIITHILAFIGGLGAGIVIKFAFDKNQVNQIGNKAGRDIIGRDNNK